MKQLVVSDRDVKCDAKEFKLFTDFMSEVRGLSDQFGYTTMSALVDNAWNTNPVLVYLTKDDVERLS